jgi:hypothetical protein
VWAGARFIRFYRFGPGVRSGPLSSCPVWGYSRRLVDRLYLVPALTVLVVGAVVLTLGASRPEVGARIYGGPTDGVSRFAWRVEVVERNLGVVTRVAGRPLRVEATLADGRSHGWSGKVDDLGEAHVAFDFGPVPVSGPVSVRVVSDRVVLADGKTALGVSAWRARARHRGGWVKKRSHGDLVVEVAPAWGVLAVQLAAPLWIDVRDERGPVEGARLTLALEGMAVQPSRAGSEQVTEQRGRAEIIVEPRDQIVALGARVEARDGRHGECYSTLPVVAGALGASLQGRALRVASSIPLGRAYFALITEGSRGPGGGIALSADGRGGAVGLVELPELPREPWWAVVSTDADLDSPSTVGWPLGVPSEVLGRDPRAWSAPDQLLLDGLVVAERIEARRRRRIAWLTASFVGVSALLSVVLVARRARAAQATIERHLAAQDPGVAPAVLPSRARSAAGIAAAVLSLALGFLLLALLGALRIG